MSDLASRVAQLEQWKISTVDPKLEVVEFLSLQNAELKLILAGLKQLGIATLSLLVGIILALFIFFINHVSVRVNNEFPSVTAPLAPTVNATTTNTPR